MASNKKKPADDTPDTETTGVETTDDGKPAAAEDGASPAAEPESPDTETAEASGIATILAEAPTLAAAPTTGNLHQRLEALELSLLSTAPDKLGAVNRIAILTGTLKTSLPDAIAQVEDEGVAASLKHLLAIL